VDLKVLEQLRNLLLRRRGQYQATFGDDTGKFVLGDLFHICHAGSTTYRGDPNDALVAEGKRQVWIHIQNMLHATDDEMYKLARQRMEEERHLR
jgi:hypothetical protein